MDENILKRLLISPSEWEVYEILLRIKSATAGKVAKESRYYRSAVYTALDRLYKRGLTSKSRYGNRTIYQPSLPKEILGILNEERDKISKEIKNFKRIIPELMLHSSKDESKTSFFTYSGTRGIRAFLDLLIDTGRKGDCICALGIPPEMRSIHGGYFKQYHRERIRKGIKTRLIFTQEALKEKYKEPAKLVSMRVLPKGESFPTEIVIMNDFTGIILPSSEPVAFAIKSREITKSFQGYFNMLWKDAKPIRT
jgi:sugar-specific transcriptional regulator TrmB